MTETAGIVHVFVRGFFYQRTHDACLGREFKYTICLMSTLIVFEGYGTTVIVPFGTVYFILPIEEVGAGDDTSSCFNFINARYLERKFVSRFGILLLVQLRLELICRRRLYIVHISFLYRADFAGCHLLAVRRPADIS